MINVQASNHMQNTYYSIEEIAAQLKVAYITVYRWIRSGKLEAHKANKQYRISSEHLQNFLEGCK